MKSAIFFPLNDHLAWTSNQVCGRHCVWHREWWDGLHIDGWTYEDETEKYERFRPSTLCWLPCTLPFALSFPCVELCKGLVYICLQSEAPAVLCWEKNSSSGPHTLWYSPRWLSWPRMCHSGWLAMNQDHRFVLAKGGWGNMTSVLMCWRLATYLPGTNLPILALKPWILFKREWIVNWIVLSRGS